MIERSDLKAGIRLGAFTLLQRVASSKKNPPATRKRWRVRCECGGHYTIPESYLIRKGNPKTHCGCKNIKTSKTLYNQEYRIWCMMRQRCYTNTHIAYKDYGGRGIKICDLWLDPIHGFDRFLAFVGPRPSSKHSIDRVDVNGNYEPYHPVTGEKQVRWATAKEQAYNTRAAIERREKAKAQSQNRNTNSPTTQSLQPNAQVAKLPTEK